MTKLKINEYRTKHGISLDGQWVNKYYTKSKGTFTGHQRFVTKKFCQKFGNKFAKDNGIKYKGAFNYDSKRQKDI